jgi:hypothetical protein
MTRHAHRALVGRSVLAGALTLALAGCGGGGIGDTLGLTYESPNPFNVAPRAPLRLPPNLEALPPPEPGAPSPLDPRPVQEARAALGGVGAPIPEGAPSPGELALLDAAGADQADPTIRSTLAAEEAPTTNEYGLSTFFGFEVPDGSEREILEPREEAERLRAEGAVTPTAPPTEPPPPTDEIQFDF